MAVTFFCFGLKADNESEITQQNLETVKAVFGSLLNSNGTQQLCQQQTPVVINAVPVSQHDGWDSSKEKPASHKQIDWVHSIIRNNRLSETDICNQYHCRSIDELPYSACNNLIKQYGEKH